MKLTRVAPEAAAVGAGQVMAALASIASIRILTELLRPEDFGKLAVAFTVAALPQLFVLSPIGMACVRYYAPSCEGGYVAAFVRSMLTLCGAGTLVLAVIGAAAWAGLLASGRSAWIPDLRAAMVYAWLGSVSSLLDGVQNAGRQRVIVALHQGAGGLAAAGVGCDGYPDVGRIEQEHSMGLFGRFSFLDCFANILLRAHAGGCKIE